MGKALVAKLGLPGPVLLGESSFGDIYIDRASRRRTASGCSTAAVAAYRAHPQVEAVFTADAARRDSGADRRRPTNGP